MSDTYGDYRPLNCLSLSIKIGEEWGESGQVIFARLVVAE